MVEGHKRRKGGKIPKFKGWGGLGVLNVATLLEMFAANSRPQPHKIDEITVRRTPSYVWEL